MNCPSCKKEIVPDSVFCAWCNDFVPSSGQGKKANLFRRWVAFALDPLIAVVLYLVGVGIVGAISKDLGIVAAVGLPIVYLVWFLSLLRRGLTPGKKLMGLQVVDHQTGTVPGFGKMFVREIVGRAISGLFGGLGYFWAIFDKNSQAWHDKIAGTVVLKVAPPTVLADTALSPTGLDPVPAPVSTLSRPSPAPPAPRFSFSAPQLLAAGIAVVLFAAGAVWLSRSHAGAGRAHTQGSAPTSVAHTVRHPTAPRTASRAGELRPGTRLSTAASRRATSLYPAGATAPAPSKSANDYSGVAIQPSKEPSHSDSAARLRPYALQFAFLIGEWESQTPGNHYRMRVAWDSPSKQFRGYLTKQGQVSENVGFQLGELVWTAVPRGERMFTEQQKWRYGANRLPTDYQWRNGNFDVERSSPDHLVSFQEFMRVP
jgi:uncharacterized RDD family membrane protein YckC